MKPSHSGPTAKPAFKTFGLIEQICNVLSEAILNGELTGGERLKETELQRQFQVSRSPVREALRELEKRGLVVIIPRRGTFVKSVTLAEIEQNFAARAVLEGLAAREAHARMDQADLEELKLSFEHMKKAAWREDSEAVMEKIYQFHKTFILCSRNEAVINCLRNLPVHIMWKRFVRAYSPEEMKNAVQRHEKILKVFLNKDSSPEGVERAVREHLVSSVKRLGRYLDQEKMLDLVDNEPSR